MKPILIYLILLLIIVVIYMISIENVENFLETFLVGAGKIMTTPFSKSFLIEDRMFGWHKWWRDNQSFYSVKNDDSFKGTAYETYSKNLPLLYDGVRPVNELSSYLP
jgi:hypothetical protein